MNDKTISALWAGAIACWGIGFVLILIGLIWPRIGTDQLGVFIGMVGATLQVRSWFCSQAARETEAFNLGREYEGTVRTIR